ncbi:histone methyltransferase set2 [Pichia californica]|uniref:Histone-lysine N-methyltransferase, H3 lysine-36 specific n=1 Tax=Pichia californica TaxID=460514 RepID=A0A9P7BFU5_9ASCO|nr:histone methyltransferase set2 [[Candida] californica]KAG0687633.1 histone methyltransferase set2 [[Candida] californica]
MVKYESITLTSEDEASSYSTPPTENEIQLFTDYEDKTEDVKKQFVVLKENQYIGSLKNVFSATNEFMTCDCEQEMYDGVNVSCGADSDCINRLTNIECVNDQCGCGNDCLNQRFQRREYANISIFLTENKGYGVRANVDIAADTFIIEYIGDIVDGEEYKTRKEKYDSEAIKHFYFMMIQDNEIIDATKRASLARYCNHSCDPNAYIEKWVVNKRFRMGIFAKRNIKKGEEICFDYNVDRYGAEPQKCYCGASNCLGVMGGKTQSDTVSLLPHTITEALGVRAVDEKKWLKEQKKKGIKVTNDNDDSTVNVKFVKSLDLKPLDLSDIAKVSSCLMQPDLDLLVIDRILERFVATNEESLENLLIRFNRLHGIQALGNALKTLITSIGNSKSLNSEQKSVLGMIIYLFESWPKLKSKNSIHDSEIETSLNNLSSLNIPSDFQERIEVLINGWSDLKVIYKIPKKAEFNSAKPILDDRRSRLDEITDKSPVNKLPTGPASLTKVMPWGDLDVSALPDNRKVNGEPLPPGWEWTVDQRTGIIYYFNRNTQMTQWDKPDWSLHDEEEKRRRKERDREREREKELRDLKKLERERALQRQTEIKLEEEKSNILSSIIAQASRDNRSNTPSKPAKVVPKTVPKGPRSMTTGNGNSNGDGKSSSEASRLNNENFERKWMSLFASYVPNILKRYEAEIGRDNLKRCARDIAHLLTDKEVKRHAGKIVPNELSDERKIKVKAFCKNYMSKFLQKFDERKKRKSYSQDNLDSAKKQKV